MLIVNSTTDNTIMKMCPMQPKINQLLQQGQRILNSTQGRSRNHDSIIRVPASQIALAPSYSLLRSTMKINITCAYTAIVDSRLKASA